MIHAAVTKLKILSKNHISHMKGKYPSLKLITIFAYHWFNQQTELEYWAHLCQRKIIHPVIIPPSLLGKKKEPVFKKKKIFINGIR